MPHAAQVSVVMKLLPAVCVCGNEVVSCCVCVIMSVYGNEVVSCCVWKDGAGGLGSTKQTRVYLCERDESCKRY